MANQESDRFVNCIAAPTVYQISQYNTDVGAKAIDGNITTCSLSGYHTKPWYVLDFGADTTISTVKIAGK